MGIKTEKLASTIQKELGVYSDKVTAEVKKVTDSVSEEAVAELNDTSPRRTGKYSKSWATKVSFENTRTKRSTVHNRKHYSLTHLLEKGHILKRKNVVIGNVAPHTHIAAVEQRAIEKLEKGIKGAVDNAT